MMEMASIMPASLAGQSYDVSSLVSAISAQDMKNITDVWGQTYDFSVPGDYGYGGGDGYGGGFGSDAEDDFGEGPGGDYGGGDYGGGFGGDDDDGNADAEGGGQGQYRKGGLARKASIFGEHGPEWAVPTYEPERSQFLRDVGADPDKIAAAITKKMGERSGAGALHITVEIGGEEFDTRIERVSDNVRVKAERRELGTQRMYH
jgi:hypothetical protein